MESIEIKSFLTIDYAHFEIKKINILIGAQAQGKSVIAKLVFLFKKRFIDIFIEGLKKFETKNEIYTKCLFEFQKVFPQYSWIAQDFSICYTYKNVVMTVENIKKSNEYLLELKCSEDMVNFFQIYKERYNLLLEQFNEQENKEDIFDGLIFPEINEAIFTRVLKNSIFIPANRSLLITLQKNIFSFIASDIDIDQFMKWFGSSYEQSKRFLQIGSAPQYEVIIEKKVDSLINDIIIGKYVYADQQDWILYNGNKTNLNNTSSGQQEALPMLLVLKVFSFIYQKEITNFFIEEPEAHLFPTSQKQIISLIATIYNAFGHSFFITTHSPYILTAINNLVAGKDAYDKANGDIEKLNRLEKVFAFDELIRLEDVSAYTLNKGKLESIINMENRLIGANLLDAVSDEFDEAFGVATDILYGDE